MPRVLGFYPPSQTSVQQAKRLQFEQLRQRKVLALQSQRARSLAELSYRCELLTLLQEQAKRWCQALERPTKAQLGTLKEWDAMISFWTDQLRVCGVGW